MSLSTAQPGANPRSGGSTAWRRFRRHRLAVVSLWVLALLFAVVVSAPALEVMLGLDADAVNLFARMAPPGAAHWLGTDELGRDLLLRLLHGGRVSLLVGFTAAVAAAVIGATLGLISGYFGGRVDAIVMRFADGVISLPLLPLLIVLAAIDPGKLGLPEEISGSQSFSLYRIVVIIALVGWPTVARLVRAATLSLRQREFVLVALAQGFGPARIMFRHILPNTASPILVATTLTVGNVILFESVLSFLGLGIQPPMPSWGNMLTGAQDLISEAPALALWPGTLIFLTVISFNLLGDGLQAALDPRSRRVG
ncbi:MAG: ABC transporter permease [Proteobacteria bacterium]|nr:ABC transporter permease [Pseudomonadota bacterium]